MINYWLENNWISENIFLEIKSRQSSGVKDLNSIDDIIEKQVYVLYLELIDKKNISFEESINYIASEIISNSNKIVEIIKKDNLIIPNIIFDKIIEKNEKKDAVFILFNFAEKINLSFTKQEFVNSLDNYSSVNFINTKFAIREKFVDKNSVMYNGYKSINKALSIKLPNNSLVENEFYMFKSENQKNSGLQFVEVLTDKGITRNLVKPSKHLDYNSRRNFDSLKEFSTEKVKNIEVLYNSYLLVVEALGDLSLNHMESPDFGKNIHDILAFFLNYIPSDFKKLSKISENISFIDNTELKEKYLKDFIKYSKISLLKIKFGLEKFIDKGQNFDVLQENLTKRNLKFDSKFLDNLEEQGLEKRAYDEELSSCGEEINIVEVNQENKQEKYSINFFSESSAINALNLKQNKKIIIVSGGCKEVNINGVSSLDLFSDSVIKYSLNNFANLSIPGTQSGIGVSMSKKYLEYKDKFKFISSDNKFRMFAVSPRNNMADNDYESDSKYAPNPIDQIYMPYNADWGITDETIIEAGYFGFIKQAELIYNRLDNKNNRLHIIGNGGLFTIAELISSMKNKSDVIIVNKTGRFSDLSSVLLKQENLTDVVLGVNNLENYSDFGDLILKIDELASNGMDDYNELISKDFGNIKEFKNYFENNKDKKIESIDNLFKDLVEYQKENNLNTNPKQILYWIYLIKFLKLSINKKPEVVDLEDLDGYLQKI